MKLSELLDRSDLDVGIKEGLIRARTHGGLTIFNYSDAAMYTPGAWNNDAVRKCRGLIVDAADNIVARPWAKFFNYGQGGADEIDPSAHVQVTDKADGSLGILYLDEHNSPRVATRGSLTSDQAIHATQVLHDRYLGGGVRYSSAEQVTYLFEIIYPENRIVLNYGEMDDLVLLGAVVIQSGLYVSPSMAQHWLQWPGPVVEVFDYLKLEDALAAPPRPNAEGLVVRQGNKIVKIKQEDYIRLHRIVTGLSEKSVWQHVVDGGNLAGLLDGLPDEFADWATNHWRALWDEVNTITHRVEDAFFEIMTDGPPGASVDRGLYASEAKKYGDLTQLLFMRFDGKDLTPAILKRLKPMGDTRAKVFSEDVA